MSRANEVFEKWLPQARKGLLEMVILKLLARKTSYGYEIASQVRQAMNADIAEGTLYPLLKRLSRDGLVTSEWRTEADASPRKYYVLTRLGSEVSEMMGQEVERVMATMTTLATQAKPDAPTRPEGQGNTE